MYGSHASKGLGTAFVMSIDALAIKYCDGERETGKEERQAEKERQTDCV